MRKHLLVGAVALAAFTLAATQANSTPVTTNTWYEFGFTGTGGDPLVSGVGFVPATNAPDGNPIVQVGNPAWTITSAVPLKLYVQDLFIANAALSRGTYILPAGSDSITGIHVQGVPGAAVFELTPVATPEPSSLAMLGAALLALAAGLGLIRRDATAGTGA